MKSQKNIQKLYEDTLAAVETAKKTCVNCGSVYEDHTPEADYRAAKLPYCVQGEYSRRFTINTLAIAAAEKQANILQWVLDQEETYISIDDCIMPETVIATFSKKKIANLPTSPKICDKCKGPMSETQPILFPGLYQCEDGDCENSMMFPEQELDFPLGFDVNVDDLDEPYRGILLANSNKLPITLPGVLHEVVQVVSFAIFPSGAVYRNFNEISENLFEDMDKSELKPALIQILNKQMAEELSNRYGGK